MAPFIHAPEAPGLSASSVRRLRAELSQLGIVDARGCVERQEDLDLVISLEQSAPGAPWLLQATGCAHLRVWRMASHRSPVCHRTTACLGYNMMVAARMLPTAPTHTLAWSSLGQRNTRRQNALRCTLTHARTPGAGLPPALRTLVHQGGRM